MCVYRPAILALFGLLAAFTVSGAVAQEQTQPSTDMPATTTFGRWTTIIDALDTGQDSHKTCAASTAFLDGSGNAGTLTLSISTGDALPPNAYPAIMFTIANKELTYDLARLREGIRAPKRELAAQKNVEEDLQRLIPGARLMSTSGFAEAVIRHMND